MFKKIAVGVLVLMLVIYSGLLAYLYVNQRAFFFSPDGETFDPAAVGLDAEIVMIPTGDDEVITGWYAPPTGNEPAILYLKGNTGSFSSEYERFIAFTDAGYGFLSVDYRGFPLSPGEITQDNLLADAISAFDWLSERETDIVIWGRSLGASPAVWVASQRD
uniref:alpha/beta hydrolase n=1 Tax=Pelagibacterium sp. TaxID=1967288 RepID=UPI003A95A6A4